MAAMAGERLTKELKILEKNYSRLADAITNPESLALKLLSAQLITDATLRNVNTLGVIPATKVYYMLNDVRAAVAVDSRNFHNLIQALFDSNSVALEAFAKSMQEEYETDSDAHHQQEVIHAAENDKVSQQRIKEVPVIEKRVAQDYIEMQGKLGRLFYAFKEKIEDKQIQLISLKDFITCCRPYDDCNELKEAATIAELLHIVRKKLCSLTNYTILIDIADHFKLTGAFDVIGTYEAEQQNYQKKLISYEFVKELEEENAILSHNPTIEGIIVLRLRSSSSFGNSLYVSEFEKIVKEVFSELYRYVHILKVEAGSIIVTMCAPEQVTGALIALAKGKIAYLTDVGVTCLTIGKTIIMEVSDDHDVSRVTEKESKLNGSSCDNNAHSSCDDDDDKTSSIPHSAGSYRVTQLSQQPVDDEGDDSTDKGMGSDSATPEYNQTWQHYPFIPRTMIIIGSYGNHSNWYDQMHIISPKIPPRDFSLAELGRKEMKKILDLYKRNPEYYHIQSVCYDLPGKEQSRSYYLMKIKEIFMNCKQSGIIIFYTGHGEKNTGNWCFKDGVISFNDIFNLYMMHCTNERKSLSIVSDCSYSGKWIHECSKRLDEMNVPSCGHHTREQGLLFQIFTSCQHDEEATALCYVNEALEFCEAAGNAVLHNSNKRLTSGQKSDTTDFRTIRCGQPADETCKTDSCCTWKNHLKSDLIYRVLGEDRGRSAWYYVLVDKDKIEEFKIQLKAEKINLEKYGSILKSGYGKEPPKEIEQKLKLQYGICLDLRC